MRVLLPALLLAAALPAVAAPPSLEERLAAKLEEPFLKNAAWVLDYDAALARAKESGQPVFGYFTRSYAP